MMKTILAVAIACAAPLGAALATTNTACVGSATELTNALSALSTSSTSTDADEIRIRTGTYFAPAGGWTAAVTTHHALAIRGGYTDAACTLQALDAARTVLDGNNASGVMTINTPNLPDSDIEVSGLTFQHGKGGNAFESSAGGLKIGDPNPISNGRILVERNIFRDNSSTTNGFSQAIGGLLAATDGQLVVRGNLFVGNISPNAAAVYLYSNNAIDFSNNTVTGNHSTDTTAPIRVALAYITFGGLISSNNIYWGNATGPDEFDLSLSPLFSGVAGATLLHDDVQAASGTAASASGTLHVDPGFVGNGDFHLAPNSPLIDAGVNDPAGGVTGVDLDGAARIRGAAVDLGAYESSASVAGPAIGAGFSGNWFDPTAGQDGHGFQIEVLPDNGMLAIWFVFNPQGTAQSWIYAQGVYATGSNSVTVPAFLETGGRFPPNFNSSMLTTTPWGSLTFTFADCSNGTATWTSNTASAAAGYADVSFPIRRVTSLAGTSCP